MLKFRLLLLAGVILAACVAGCAHPQPVTPPAPVATSPPPPMSPAQQVQHTQTVQAMQQSARARGRMLHQQAGKQ